MKRIPVFENKFTPTPIYCCNGQYAENEIYIKRDDLLPFSFGGNKVRKAQKFYQEIIELKPDVLVTYGSSSSNHCRIIANLAKALEISCEIISPEENKHETPNSKIVASLGAKVRYCALNQVKETIDKTMEELAEKGKPYFIMGGGHGNPGTEGYKDAYEEIVGISIARLAEPGGNVVLESVTDYFEDMMCKDKITKAEKEEYIQKAKTSLCFTDRYRLEGYGAYNEEVLKIIKAVEEQDGVAMDTTYVGKAFWGMTQYLKEENIRGKKILFIHTGGTPLYFEQF